MNFKHVHRYISSRSYSGTNKREWQWHWPYSFSLNAGNNNELSWSQWRRGIILCKSYVSLTNRYSISQASYWDLKEMELVGV